MSASELTTARLRIRRFRLDDLANMRALEGDADVVRFTSYRVPQTPAQTEARLQTLVASEPTHAPLGVWAVERLEDGAFVGWFMVRKTEFEWPELGFMLARARWGGGYATEAAQALADHALGALGCAELVARTNPENAASIRVLEKVGFRLKERIRRPDPTTGAELELNLFTRSR